MNRLTKSVVVAATLLMSPLLTQAALTVDIDTFNSATDGIYPNTRTTVAVGSVFFSPTPDLNTACIGGRRIAAAGLYGKTASRDNVSLGVYPDDLSGIYDFASSSGATGVGELIYGDFGGQMPAISLAVPNGSLLKIDFLDYDLPSGQSLAVRTSLANGALFEEFTGFVTSAGPQTFTFTLDAFNPAIRANVTGMAVTFFAPKAADFRLDAISLAIPEPTTGIALLPLGMLLARRHRA